MTMGQMIAGMLAMYTFGIVTGGFLALLGADRLWRRCNRPGRYER